jgi:hypothetical protein
VASAIEEYCEAIYELREDAVDVMGLVSPSA